MSPVSGVAGPMSAGSFRLRAFATALTLLSGAVMVLAGYVGNSESWTSAGLIAILGGVVILAAKALARRADHADRQMVATSDSHRQGGAAVMAATLLSGGVMVFAGYAGSAWGWGLAVPLAIVGGLVIGVAFVLDRHGTWARPR